jgi:hypothetical protein
MSHEFKVCPACREEYTLVPSVCAECDTALIYLDDLEPDPEADDFPETSQLECVRVGPLPWTRAISEALGEAEIAHRVEPDTRSEAEGGVDPRRFASSEMFGTWVRPKDLAAAQKIDDSLFGQVDPEEQEAASEEDTCPACEATLPVDALECPDCGLGFG